MTANDTFKTAAAYLSQTVDESDDLTAFVLPWINVLLAESLEAENSVRMVQGQELLVYAPELLQLEDEIPYCAAIVRIALPYGLASEFFRADDDKYSAENFRAKYVNAVSDAMAAAAETVRDVY